MRVEEANINDGRSITFFSPATWAKFVARATKENRSGSFPGLCPFITCMQYEKWGELAIGLQILSWN